MSSALDLGYATMLQSMAAAVPAVVEAAGRRRELAEARPTHAEAPKPRPHLSLSSAAQLLTRTQPLPELHTVRLYWLSEGRNCNDSVRLASALTRATERVVSA